MTPDHPLLLFDGICHLCTGSVRFILKRDRKGEFRFATLQSRAGREYLARYGLPAEEMASVALIEDGKAYRRSAAALRVLRRLGWPWKALWALMLVPRPLRDFGYDVVAKNRYRVFGKREACMLPAPEVRDRFLE